MVYGVGNCIHFSSWKNIPKDVLEADYSHIMDQYICGAAHALSPNEAWLADEGAPLMPLYPKELEGDWEGRPSRRIQSGKRWYTVGVEGKNAGHASRFWILTGYTPCSM